MLLAFPLTNLVFASTFANLKAAITKAIVLSLPDFSKPSVLETDAWSIEIGAVLSQNMHHIAFFSRKLHF